MTSTTDELHRKGKFEPINQRLTHRTNNIWNKFQGMRTFCYTSNNLDILKVHFKTY